jgi:hypothetical protein
MSEHFNQGREVTLDSLEPETWPTVHFTATPWDSRRIATKKPTMWCSAPECSHCRAVNDPPLWLMRLSAGADRDGMSFRDYIISLRRSQSHTRPHQDGTPFLYPDLVELEKHLKADSKLARYLRMHNL